MLSKAILAVRGGWCLRPDLPAPDAALPPALPVLHSLVMLRLMYKAVLALIADVPAPEAAFPPSSSSFRGGTEATRRDDMTRKP